MTVNGGTSVKDATASPTLETTTSLEALQSEEQRNVLNIVDQLRKCGLESMLSLPQLVVCGDQSAGKSSVLEALTQIPFPRNDNLCTRYATEIILRRGISNAISIKVIPDTARPVIEQQKIASFKEAISDFDELPQLMDKATGLMGIGDNFAQQIKAFSKDILSIEIEGPSRPQLTLVDLPGLIQTQTKGVTEEEVSLVREITDQYISQHRTICLAVVSATNDYANQGILKKVREVDPEGNRTLGIITKPDRLPAGSGSEMAYISLANNEDVFFKLGWHVLKNRSYEQSFCSFDQRNMYEAEYFRKSNFSILPKDTVGIDALRERLSRLLFNHVKQELPKLREDLSKALTESTRQLSLLGERRASADECRVYLMQLSLDFYEIGKAAVNGHYEGEYFINYADPVFSPESPAAFRRLRAVIQYMNYQFSTILRTRGHKYHIARSTDDKTPVRTESDSEPDEPVVTEAHESNSQEPTSFSTSSRPISLTRSGALKWATQALVRTRGKELPGAFNPLLISELFWEQSEKWKRLAEDHIQGVTHICRLFLEDLLSQKCPKDVYDRLISLKVEDALQTRSDESAAELQRILGDLRSHPSTYNHYYTDTIKKRRIQRSTKSLANCVEQATRQVPVPDCNSGTHTNAVVDVNQIAKTFTESMDPDMEKHSCEEALDCLYSIYKVSFRCNFLWFTASRFNRFIFLAIAEDLHR